MSISVHEGCVADFLDSVVAKAIGEIGDTALDPETMIKNAELFSSQAAEAISVSDSVPKEQETIEEIEGETQPGEPALAGEEAGEGAGGGARAGGGAGAEAPAALAALAVFSSVLKADRRMNPSPPSPKPGPGIAKS